MKLRKQNNHEYPFSIFFLLTLRKKTKQRKFADAFVLLGTKF